MTILKRPTLPEHFRHAVRRVLFPAQKLYGQGDNAKSSEPVDIIGFVDGIRWGRLHGWAFDRARAQRRLTVVLSLPGHPPRYGLADRYRVDLYQKGYGDGHYGFSFPISVGCEDGTMVEAVDVRGCVQLKAAGARRSMNSPRARTYTSHSHRLHIDDLTFREHVSGWALNIDQRNSRSVLRLRRGGFELKTSRATLYRSELVDETCDGFHGFLFPLPAKRPKRLTLEDLDSGLTFEIR